MFSFWSRPHPTQRIYLDHAASTPTHEKVVAAMLPYVTAGYGNPSAIHAEGRQARTAIEEARASVAKTLGIKPAGIVFTSGGTEANNLAIVGYLKKLHGQGRAFETMEVITTALEHPSITETLAEVESWGVVVKTVDVDGEGKIILSALKALLSAQTVLCSFAYANSEIGVIQKVQALARELRQYERDHAGVRIALHIDAAQAPLWLPCDLPRLDADFITLDGAKCGGPKGTGVLAARKGGEVVSILFGGGQESGLRPGTENVAGIVGMAVALSIAQNSWQKRADQVSQVRDAALVTLARALPAAVLNGPVGESRIANNINISLPGLDTEYAVVVLDQAGIAASTKSACAGAGSGQSVVVHTITEDSARAGATLRFTLSDDTTDTDMTTTFTVLAKHIKLMATLTK